MLIKPKSKNIIFVQCAHFFLDNKTIYEIFLFKINMNHLLMNMSVTVTTFPISGKNLNVPGSPTPKQDTPTELPEKLPGSFP